MSAGVSRAVSTPRKIREEERDRRPGRPPPMARPRQFSAVKGKHCAAAAAAAAPLGSSAFLFRARVFSWLARSLAPRRRPPKRPASASKPPPSPWTRRATLSRRRRPPAGPQERFRAAAESCGARAILCLVFSSDGPTTNSKLNRLNLRKINPRGGLVLWIFSRRGRADLREIMINNTPAQSPPESRLPERRLGESAALELFYGPPHRRETRVCSGAAAALANINKLFPESSLIF